MQLITSEQAQDIQRHIQRNGFNWERYCSDKQYADEWFVAVKHMVKDKCADIPFLSPVISSEQDAAMERHARDIINSYDGWMQCALENAVAIGLMKRAGKDAAGKMQYVLTDKGVSRVEMLIPEWRHCDESERKG